MHLVYPLKFCITILFHFSWDDCKTREKLDTIVWQNIILEVNYMYYSLSKRGKYENKY